MIIYIIIRKVTVGAEPQQASEKFNLESDARRFVEHDAKTEGARRIQWDTSAEGDPIALTDNQIFYSIQKIEGTITAPGSRTIN